MKLCEDSDCLCCQENECVVEHCSCPECAADREADKDLDFDERDAKGTA